MAKIIEITENVEEIAKISEMAKTILEKENGIQINNEEAIPQIVYTFIKSAMKMVSDNKAPDTEVSINLFHLLDIGVTHEEVDGEKDGNYTPFVAPGQEFKLLVKSDDSTED